MNKFKKKTRSKMIAASIAILSSAAVVSTGFAAWVISGGESKEAGGTITADAVTNSYHTIKGEITWGTGEKAGSIAFGAPAKMENTNVWLKNTNNPLTEKLETVATFTVENVHENETDLIENVVMEETDPEKKYAAISDTTEKNGYVCALPTYKKDSKDSVSTTDAGIYLTAGARNATDNTVTYTMTVRFAWGKYFAKGDATVNPYIFFNEKAKDSSNFSEATNVLNSIYGLNGVKFKITVIAK